MHLAPRRWFARESPPLAAAVRDHHGSVPNYFHEPSGGADGGEHFNPSVSLPRRRKPIGLGWAERHRRRALGHGGTADFIFDRHAVARLVFRLEFTRAPAG